MESLRQIAEKAEHDRKEIKRHAQELVEKVKSDAEAQRYMIDRRMITRFLLNYVNPKSHNLVKLQMVDAMSKILEFSNEERVTLGLKPVHSGSGGPLTPTQSSDGQQAVNIADKLVSYFLHDE